MSDNFQCILHLLMWPVIKMQVGITLVTRRVLEWSERAAVAIAEGLCTVVVLPASTNPCVLGLGFFCSWPSAVSWRVSLPTSDAVGFLMFYSSEIEKMLPHKFFWERFLDSLITIDINRTFFFCTDVMDVAWSPHDAWLASCSVDNTVVIWNAVKFPGENSYTSDVQVCKSYCQALLLQSGKQEVDWK